MTSLNTSDVSREIFCIGQFTFLGSADLEMGAAVVVGLDRAVLSTFVMVVVSANTVEVDSELLELQATTNMPATRMLMIFFTATSCSMQKVF